MNWFKEIKCDGIQFLVTKNWDEDGYNTLMECYFLEHYYFVKLTCDKNTDECLDEVFDSVDNELCKEVIKNIKEELN